MSGRCKSCNAILNESEVRFKVNEEEPNDLCRVCTSISREEYSYANDHSYQFEGLEEGLNYYPEDNNS